MESLLRGTMGVGNEITMVFHFHGRVIFMKSGAYLHGVKCINPFTEEVMCTMETVVVELLGS